LALSKDICGHAGSVNIAKISTIDRIAASMPQKRRLSYRHGHGESSRVSSRTYDLVLFGASGFTGRLVAEYLQKNAGPTRWAIAGRDRAKLEKTKEELGLKEVPILIADSRDEAALKGIAEQTKVVCSTVGPYAKYGTPLVEQCVAAGTAYCDLTGESHWIRVMIDQFHERAVQSGARIVHCCGFDSIPSDLGTLMMAEYAERVQKKKVDKVRMRVMSMRGGVSGGTVASMLGIFEAAKDKKIRGILGDPYSLLPKGAPRGPDKNDNFTPHKDEDRGRWTGPFIMASVNTRIVRRSNALLGYRYGDDFSYEEATDTGRGASGWMRSTAMTAALGAFAATATLPGFSALYGKILPQPGEGPSKEKRESGSFRFQFFADGATGTVAGRGDPGYAATSCMLGEASLCLANDALSSDGGILTPASAMGFTLIERLKKAGMTFEVTGQSTT
jgi:short subunit dehydrogenase-like uncharacterized protein